MSNGTYIDMLTEQAVRDLLEELINRLDELDQDDSFGSEGWRHSFNMEYVGRND